MAVAQLPDKHLPATRLARRRASPSAALAAIAVALVLNLVVLVVLARLGATRHAPPLPPVHSAIKVDRALPPPPVEDEAVVESETEPEVADVAVLPAIPLPALDLPALARGDGPLLPAMPPGDPALVLPLAMPAFAAIAPESPDASISALAAPVDAPARILGGVELERFYPREASKRGIEGQSRIELTIARDGRVTACKVLSSDPPGVFEQAATDLAATIRCAPATRDGQPTESTVIQTIVWKIRNR